MENKRMSNKLNSWFWFILTALPIIFIFFSIILLIVHYREFDLNNLGIEYINLTLNDSDFWSNALGKFNDFSISYVYETFYNLFETLGVNDNYDYLATIFSWMLSVQVYHLIYDVLKFIIEWCHNLIEKAY